VSKFEPVAITGIGCRFPAAHGPDEFWRLLAAGIDAIQEVPADRWSLEDLYDRDPAAAGKMNTRWGGFLSDVDAFDAAFFGISPREAMHIDPQQRLLLETTWEALEDGGIAVEKLAGQRVGVFVGVTSSDYGHKQLSDLDGIVDGYGITGSALSIAANRLSYAFDFRGPSLVIDTACSSSLVAIYEACHSLHRGESSIALAGGVNVILSPAVTIGLSKLQALAPDGRCKAFDARANGFVRGEGSGIVVLKPLANALADRDRIYAVIRGGAVNHDGRTNGLTAPNGLSQEALLRQAFSNAGVASSEIQYVEANGTGTALGDPIELNALGAVLAGGRSREARCAVGSVKTNVGTLEAASGVAGLIKLALAIQHRQLPPSLHFEKPNPYVRFDVLPLRVVTTLEHWPDHAGPARGGVSAFGFGGTNAHLVLEESAAPCGPEPSDHQSFILPISARSQPALSALAHRFLALLADDADAPPLDEICASAAVRRSHHDFRLAAVAASRSEMASIFASFLQGEQPGGVETGRRIASRRRKLAFVFPGHGSQWIGMGRELTKSEPVFAESIDKCAAALSKHVEWSLKTELELDEEHSRLDDVDVFRRAIFAVQVALAELWRSWGIKADVVVGRGTGEVAAAYVAGALTLDDAAGIVCNRRGIATDRATEPVRAQASRLPFCSARTGTRVAGAELGSSYWARNLDEPDMFREAIDKLLHDGIEVFLEISAHPTLLSTIKECMVLAKRDGVALGSLRRNEDERRSLLSSVASLYAVGKPVEWAGLFAPGRVHVPLPTYPWQRERFWFEPSAGPSAKSRGSRKQSSRLIGDHIRPVGQPAIHLWQRELSSDACPFPTGCRGNEEIVLSPSIYIEMALEAAKDTLGADTSLALAAVHFGEPLQLNRAEARKVQVILTRKDETFFEWQVCTELPGFDDQELAQFSQHARGELHVAQAETAPSAIHDALASARAHCNVEMRGADYYRALDDLQIEHPPPSQCIESIWIGEGEAVAQVGESDGESPLYQIDPAVLDAALQILVGSVTAAIQRRVTVTSMDAFRVHPRCTGSKPAWVHVRWTVASVPPTGEVRLHTGTGELVAEATGIVLSPGDGSEAAVSRSAVTAAVDPLLVPEFTREQLLEVAPGERAAVLADHLRQHIANVLRIPPAQIDLDQSLLAMGIDSLMAVELKNRIETKLGVSISLAQLIKGPTLTELAHALVGSAAGTSSELPSDADSPFSTLISAARAVRHAQ
jgi:acyl transferase domain-containing protein/aryl carrier-like protein